MNSKRLKELEAQINLSQCRTNVANVMRAIADAVETGEFCIESIDLNWAACKNNVDFLHVEFDAALCLPRLKVTE